MKNVSGFIFSFVLMLMLVACTQGNNADADTPNTDNANGNNMGNNADVDEDVALPPDDPVTLSFLYPETAGPFEGVFKEPIEAKFPHITVEHLNGASANMDELQEFVAAQTLPDLVFHNHNGGINNFRELGMDLDLMEFVDQYNMDLSRFRPGTLEWIARYDHYGELYALPYFNVAWAMYYNRELFDRFGVPYPTDDMTWNEAMDVAQEMIREDDGVQFRGLSIGWEAHPLEQLKPLSVNPETDEPMYTEDPRWAEYFEMIDRLFSIPGNYPNGMDDLFSHQAPFMEERNLAMYAGQEITNAFAGMEEPMDWDVVTYPTFESQPNVTAFHEGALLGISSTSDHPDVAFQVIDYLTSEEYQMELSRRGFLTPLDRPDVIAEFGRDYNLDDKNFEAYFAHELPTPNPPRVYQDDYSLEGMPNTIERIEQVMSGETDVNTILREMQEQAETAVIESRAMQ